MAVGLAVVVGVWAAFGLPRGPAKLDQAAFNARYSDPLAAPDQALAVYHLGHSLVGRDMPVMLDQLAAAAGFNGHSHASQLGWGATLGQHAQGPDQVPGYDTENDHPFHRPVREAVASADYGAVVLTEMVEIRDAVKHHDSAQNLGDWAQAVRTGNPNARVYLYETWHQLDDPEGWLERIDADLARHWEGDLLRVAKARADIGTIYVIPGGQVLARVVRAMEAGSVPGLTRREQLFALTPEGAVDPIHLNDIGAYIIALTHFAVLYHQSPEGLPEQLMRADGTPAQAPPQAAIGVLQRVVWEVVTGYAPTGVTQR
jgi:hypothetical protein